jgi:hypothetical protein
VAPEGVTTRSTRDRYLLSSLMEEAITSSQMEGAATTRDVAKAMMTTDSFPKLSAKAVALYARAVADAVLEGKANATAEVVQAVSEGDEFVEVSEDA